MTREIHQGGEGVEPAEHESLPDPRDSALGQSGPSSTADHGSAFSSAAIDDSRARTVQWLQENAELFLDFDVLADRERAGLTRL